MYFRRKKLAIFSYPPKMRKSKRDQVSEYCHVCRGGTGKKHKKNNEKRMKYEYQFKTELANGSHMYTHTHTHSLVQRRISADGYDIFTIFPMVFAQYDIHLPV